MHYLIIVILTFVQTLCLIASMGLSVIDFHPYTIRLWCNYIMASMLLWSPLLFTSKRRWTYIISLLLCVWFVGNLAYFRSYGDVLSRWSLSSAGNLAGFETAVIPFLHASDCVFIAITIVWIVLSETLVLPHLLTTIGKRICAFLVCLVLVFVPQTVGAHKAEMPLSPFSVYFGDVSMGRIWYVHTFGPITHLCNECVNAMRNHESPPVPVLEEELTPYCQVPDNTQSQKGNMLFVFFESLEYWTIGLKVGGEEVTPCLNRLAAHPMAACYPMQAQVEHGKSSDARLIAFTGLLPVYNGATAMRYASDTYPSWITCADMPTKQMFTSSNAHAWNNEMNAHAFGFDSLYAEVISDGALVKAATHSITSSERPFVIVVCTMASHSPFMEYADSASLPLQDMDFTKEKKRYLQCVHYTDSVLGCLIDSILTDSELAESTRIVITGDHPVFELDTPVPFIFYDPFLVPSEVRRTLYQMDIYTTIVERMCIPASWRGLGRNMADTSAYSPTEISTRRALSDRIIRTNYFAKKDN